MGTHAQGSRREARRATGTLAKVDAAFGLCAAGLSAIEGRRETAHDLVVCEGAPPVRLFKPIEDRLVDRDARSVLAEPVVELGARELLIGRRHDALVDSRTSGNTNGLAKHALAQPRPRLERAWGENVDAATEERP